MLVEKTELRESRGNDDELSSRDCNGPRRPIASSPRRNTSCMKASTGGPKGWVVALAARHGFAGPQCKYGQDIELMTKTKPTTEAFQTLSKQPCPGELQYSQPKSSAHPGLVPKRDDGDGESSTLAPDVIDGLMCCEIAVLTAARAAKTCSPASRTLGNQRLVGL